MTYTCHYCKREFKGSWAILLGPQEAGKSIDTLVICPDCFKVIKAAVAV